MLEDVLVRDKGVCQQHKASHQGIQVVLKEDFDYVHPSASLEVASKCKADVRIGSALRDKWACRGWQRLKALCMPRSIVAKCCGASAQ